MNASSHPPSILVIDDDEQVADILSLVLGSDGYDVQVASNGGSAIGALSRKEFSLILLDLRIGDECGLQLLPRIRELAPNVPIFMITAHGDVDSAVDAFTSGCNGYIRKPFREGDLKGQIAQAIENYHLRAEVQALRSGVPGGEDPRALIRSRDPVMEPTLKKISVAAQVTSNVVITGESGTGKELVARALHRFGPRRSQPFIAFNCAALPENLLESELFGYARGAFTDAKENKPGLFVRANRGTLFLDEIGDAPLSIQAKLLRVLQEREVLPLGATSPIPVDVRVVAATHRSLAQEVAQGRFRQDLYYRLHVLPIHVPALRERKRDVLYLAHLFATQLSSQMSLPFDGFTLNAVQSLEAHPWPGNVRELQNRIEYAIAIGHGGRMTAKNLFPENAASMPETELSAPAITGSLDEAIAPEAFPASTDSLASLDPSDLPSFKEAKDSFEKTYLERVLTAARGNIAKAARLAEKSRTEVYGLLRKHHLDPGTFKDSGETG